MILSRLVYFKVGIGRLFLTVLDIEIAEISSQDFILNLHSCPIQYHGRPCAAAPATGNKLQHIRELHDFIVSIFGELTEAEKEAIKKENEQSIAQAKALAAERAKQSKEKSGETEAEKLQKTEPKPTDNKK
ncbi:hypothetical protein FF38_09580 [Lucilia cuprina]|uniref:Uncharacterized protein n=1 Tax=Lucilia cuprina TaxID=7375 RepID=A0A0L0CD11_LUCCU|nr:hypothetical protein FF38_09580 [Lucilia cuprina]